jgi:hypothetical protein
MPTAEDRSGFAAGAAFWVTLVVVGLKTGGFRGWLIGAGVACIVAFVVWLYVGARASTRERLLAAAQDQADEKEQARLLEEAFTRYPKIDAADDRLGSCPDCRYTPVAPSCRACPRCGCRYFIREVGLESSEGRCSNCGPATTHYCNDCGGTRRVRLFLVRDFRTGNIYWDRAGFELRGA